eukprot:scaffold7738_cov133-Cylindrotheca_fusiformis.AAC.26
MVNRTIMRSIYRIVTQFALVIVFSSLVHARPYYSGQVAAFKPRQPLWLRQDCQTLAQVMERLRGGSTGEEEGEANTDSEQNAEKVVEDVEEDEDEDEDVYDTEDEEAESDGDYEDVYDDEYDQEEDSQATSVTDMGEYVEPYFIQPQLQLFLVLQQIFIFYVRIMAKRNNDRTPLKVVNPLSGMLEKQMEQSGGSNDMLKGLASSFLSSETTVMEYDLKQANSMQGGVLFTMAFNWFLHFKMEKVQPLLLQVITGTMQLIYNPLFQVYILGRNLERPFKTPVTAAQRMTETENATKASPKAAEDDATGESEKINDDEDSEEYDNGYDEEDDNDASEPEVDDEEEVDEDATTEEEEE